MARAPRTEPPHPRDDTGARHTRIIAGGCVVYALVLLAAIVIFYQAWETLQVAKNPPLANRLFVRSFLVAGVGLLVVAAGCAACLWGSVRRDASIDRALIRRAQRLRGARQMERSALASQVGEALRRDRRVLADGVGPGPPGSLPVAAALAPIPTARATRDIGVCPICQTGIVTAEEYLSCPRCNTPYHADCWEWNSGCGVYGCPVRIKT